MKASKSTPALHILEGALFVADAHYPHHGRDFLDLLQKLENGEITPPQLFLMGDNFDLLFGCNQLIQTYNSEAIALLQGLSQRLEIYCFEGNHDFLLKDIFPNINVFSRGQQPVIFAIGSKRVGLAHGDKFQLGWRYELYTKVVRSCMTIKLLRPLERWIIADQLRRLKAKDICRTIEHFEQRTVEILQHYDSGIDLVIEGHYHQAKKFGKYISLPSLACQKAVGVVRAECIDFVPLEAL